MFNLGRHINRAGMPSEKGHNAGLFCTARTGFEPVVSALRGQRPRPLDERAKQKRPT